MTKILAFHLPQFHSFPENDEWWGKGFTEWVNVKKSVPQFKGHIQPNTPLNNYYYNLLDKETRKWQAEKAKEYGIDGFCYYHYWFDGKLLIVDQHAAHEKVLYERILKEFDSKEHSSQLISPSIIISLSPQEENVLKDYMEDFLNMGFVVDSFGGSEYAISAVPVNIFNLDVKEIFIDMLDGLLDGRTINGQIIKDKMATMACKAAVKGNNKLSSLEAKKLIEEMFSLDNPYNCPHGRPTVISMSKYELEKKFKRIV